MADQPLLSNCQKATEFSKITQNNCYYAVQDYSRSARFVPIDSPYPAKPPTIEPMLDYGWNGWTTEFDIGQTVGQCTLQGRTVTLPVRLKPCVQPTFNV